MASVVFVLVWISVFASAQATIRPARLRCNSLDDPLGIVASHPKLSWLLQAVEASRRGLAETAYHIVVASSVERLARDEGDLWDSGKVFSPVHINVAYAGKPLASHTVYFWKVQVWDQDGGLSPWSSDASWTMGLLDVGDWKASWISSVPDNTSEEGETLPIFRREFQLGKNPARAMVFVSGVGQYELRLNGKKVSDDLLTPAWTNYRKTILYNTYDVTRLLAAGSNALGVMLGNGMYTIPSDPSRYAKFRASVGQPKFILQLHIFFADETESIVTSDASWKSAAGPIIFSSTYGGEDYDARREATGWDRAGFDEAGWKAAVCVHGPGGTLRPQELPPIQVMHTYRPVKISEPLSTVKVYDLGQNFSGWPRLVVRGQAAARVKLVPGELLDDQGLVSQRSSGAPVYFSYTLKGEGNEEWHPRFSYYGFRYLQVESFAAKGGNGDKPVIISIEGQFVHSSANTVGHFSSSSSRLNQIHALITAAMRSNMQTVLTDCPHREKLGWLEESHLLGSALMQNYDLERLYAKISGDIRDAHQPSGLVPDIAPEYVIFDGGFRDSPEWGSAVVLDPWIAYQHYGDMESLSANYDAMSRYVDYLSARADNHIISYGLGDWYDIGPGEPGESKLTSKGVTATAIYYLDLKVLERIALLLGKADAAEKYHEQGEAVQSAFNERMLHRQTNQYDSGSQTANAMALAVGLVPQERRRAVLENLVGDIRKHGNHVTAGDVGFHFVVQALTEGGRSDVLYDMLSRDDSPSYGYQLKMGATSLTEAWDSNPHSSQNHFMLGHAEEWFYRGLAGIVFDLSSPAGEQIRIRPALVGDISSAEASYESVLGNISAKWKAVGGRVALDISIPAGEVGRVDIPATSNISESGRDLDSVAEVKCSTGTAETDCRIGSGHYHFEWRR